LTVDGKKYSEPIIVRQDPRVTTAQPVMTEVYRLTDGAYFGARDAQQAAALAQGMRDLIREIRPKATGSAATALDAFVKRVQAVEGTAPAAGGGGRGGRGGGAGAPAAPAPATDTLWAVRGTLSGLMNSLQAADVAPTANTRLALTNALAVAKQVHARWTALRTTELASLNAVLKANGLGPIEIE
jgi:hypothetical protein